MHEKKGPYGDAHLAGTVNFLSLTFEPVYNCPNFHNVLEKIINIGNISNLPASISKLKYKLRKRIRLEKLPI